MLMGLLGFVKDRKKPKIMGYYCTQCKNWFEAQVHYCLSSLIQAQLWYVIYSVLLLYNISIIKLLLHQVGSKFKSGVSKLPLSNPPPQKKLRKILRIVSLHILVSDMELQPVKNLLWKVRHRIYLFPLVHLWVIYFTLTTIYPIWKKIKTFLIMNHTYLTFRIIAALEISTYGLRQWKCLGTLELSQWRAFFCYQTSKITVLNRAYLYKKAGTQVTRYY